MTQKLMVFLKALEVALPPQPGQHHAITFRRCGSEKQGWEDRLALNIRTADGKGARIMLFKDGDLERPTAEHVSEIARVQHCFEVHPDERKTKRARRGKKQVSRKV